MAEINLKYGKEGAAKGFYEEALTYQEQINDSTGLQKTRNKIQKIKQELRPKILDNLNQDEKDKLYTLLKACESLKTLKGRQRLIKRLDVLGENIGDEPNLFSHILDIVDGCDGFPHGIYTLIETIRYFEGSPIPTKAMIEIDKWAEDLINKKI